MTRRQPSRAAASQVHIYEKGQRGPRQDRANSERSNKKAEVIALMKRAKGTTLTEIMRATGWQAHTVRGFSVIRVKKKKIESFKSADGERTYKTK